MRCRQVLIVEDNVDQAQTLRLFLGMMGHRIAVAASGPAAIEAARRLRPEVVLLDIGLPGLDGFEVARQIKHEHGDAVRIIAVSAYGSENDRRQSFDAGCELHLVKPADPRFIDSLLGG
ncbi:MAG TPA: response regulator [Burkholderiales bacterium]|nr:response regulator [Burkholderiales bacterium]